MPISRQVPYSSDNLQLSPEADPGQAGRAAWEHRPTVGVGVPIGLQPGPEHQAGSQPAQPQLLCPQLGEKQRHREVKSGPCMLAGRDGGKSPSACGALPISACASLASVYLSIKWECWPCQLCGVL